MQIQRTKLLSVLSEALDSVEQELVGVTDHHAKRVAWLCICMGKKLGMEEAELSALATCALLHDIALSKYRADYSNGSAASQTAVEGHCTAGEEMLQLIPGCAQTQGFILYHHECPDGSGPFGKTEAETPLGAQLIHIADISDRYLSLGELTEERLSALRSYIETQKGHLFSASICELFLSVFSAEVTKALFTENIRQTIAEIPDLTLQTNIRDLSKLFAQIIDYKSPFTRNHSVGLAEKAEAMARYYQWDAETVEQLYFAGALHDIGKLLIRQEVLEKPGKLNAEEYQHIQSHAYETFRLLSQLDGLQHVTEWASFHHEKLNGKGYPFRKTAEQLDQKARLLACLDIYQALTEDRPYKAGMPHQKAISILQEMAEKGELDVQIVTEIDHVFRTEDTGQTEHTAALFQCAVCGYIYEGDVVPQGYLCPVCNQPETAFLRIK